MNLTLYRCMNDKERSEPLMENRSCINTVMARSPQLKTRWTSTVIPYSVPPDVDIFAPGGGDGGGYVCFACGRSMNKGEPFVCISRLWMVSLESRCMTEVIDAVASLQTCIPCTLRAAHRELRWTHKCKLTQAEIYAFYVHSRLLAGATARMKSDTLVEEESLNQYLATPKPHALSFANAGEVAGGQYTGRSLRIISHNQCRSCYEAIAFSAPYMLIEIAVNIPTYSGIELRSTFCAAKYCNECSKKLFSVNDDSFTSYY